MSGFDIAIGANQDLVNSVSDAIYQAVYPKVFTGSQSLPQFQLSVGWDIKRAPAFNLSVPARSSTAPASNNATFEIDLPEVDLTISGPDMPNATATVGITILCDLGFSSGNHLSFNVSQATAAGDETPPSLWLLNNIALPFVVSAVITYLSGLQLPPLEIEGVGLATPTVAVQDSHAIVLANLAGGGTPSPPVPGTTWPDGGFFALLDSSALQAATSVGFSKLDNRFQKKGGGHKGLAHYKWSYSMNLENPQVGLSGEDISLALTLTGSAGASAGIWEINVGIDLDAYSNPKPSGVARLSIDSDNKLRVTIEKVGYFQVFVVPSSHDFPHWLTGAIISAIVDEIISSLTPLLVNFIRNISFNIWHIATFNVSVAGYTFEIAPTGMGISSYDGMIAVTGELQVSPGNG